MRRRRRWERPAKLPPRTEITIKLDFLGANVGGKGRFHFEAASGGVEDERSKNPGGKTVAATRNAGTRISTRLGPRLLIPRGGEGSSYANNEA